MVSAQDEERMTYALTSGAYETLVVDDTIFGERDRGPSMLGDIARILASQWEVVDKVCVKAGCMTRMRRHEAN